MSAKKPWFNAQVHLGRAWNKEKQLFIPVKVRVTDARELTAEKAVEILLQAQYDADHVLYCMIDWLAEQVGMTATVKNGKVRVRRVKR